MRVEGEFRQVCLQRKELPDCSGAGGGGRMGCWEELEEDQWWEELATKEPRAGLGLRDSQCSRWGSSDVKPPGG